MISKNKQPFIWSGPRFLSAISADLLVCLLLVLINIFIYLQVTDFSFVALDDTMYVLNKTQIRQPLTVANISWVFTEIGGSAANWQPLVWLSYMIDYNLWGLDAGGFHLTNALLHIINSLLLYFLFRRMTGKVWQSAVVASLFAFHPLRVESVAWVAERKDVLSAFFWLLATWLYVLYREKPGFIRYCGVALALMGGVMAKPMVITLPFTLLLLDYWPLGRLYSSANGTRVVFFHRRTFFLLVEKIPLLLMSTASCAVSYIAQQSSGAILELAPGTKAANVLIAYGRYLGKFVWPQDLACLYPMPVYPNPGEYIWWHALIAAFLLLAVTIVTVVNIRQRPYLLVGWLWFLGTLIPVIGIVQIGWHTMADRFMYIPSIGLGIMVVWGLADVLSDRKIRVFWVGAAASLILILHAVAARQQVRYWHDTETLYTHTLAVTDNNFFIHASYACFLSEEGRVDESVEQYKKSLQINPLYTYTLHNLANIYARQNKLPEAIELRYIRSRLEPLNTDNRFMLADLLLQSKRGKEAADQYAIILQQQHDNPEAIRRLAISYELLGDFDRALSLYDTALQLDPGSPEINFDKGLLLVKMKKTDGARQYFIRTLATDSRHYKARVYLAEIYFQQGAYDLALPLYMQALTQAGDSAYILNRIGLLLLSQKKRKESLGYFRKALVLDPDNQEVQRNLALAGRELQAEQVSE